MGCQIVSLDAQICLQQLLFFVFFFPQLNAGVDLVKTLCQSFNPQSTTSGLCVFNIWHHTPVHIPLRLMMFSSVDAMSVILVEKGSDPVRL